MALGRRLDGPGIDSVGPDTDRASSPAGAEGNDLVKRIQQEIPFAPFYQVLNLWHILAEGLIG